MSNFMQNLKNLRDKITDIWDWGLGIGDWGLGPIPSSLTLEFPVFNSNGLIIY